MVRFQKGALHDINLARAASDPKYAIYDGDFFTKLGVTNGNTLGGYISTVDAGGTLVLEAQTPGIALQIGTDGDDNDDSFLARQPAIGAFDITLNSGRVVAYECRAKVVQGAEVAVFFGLAQPGLGANTLVDSTGALGDFDFVGFHAAMHATDVNIDGVVRLSGAAATALAEDLSEDEDDAFNTYGFRFDGGTKLEWYFNNEKIATQTLAAASCPTGQALTPIFDVKTGEAVEKDLTIDYWQCVEMLLAGDSD